MSESSLKIDNLSLRLATLAFASWSYVIWWGVDRITNEISAIHNEQVVTAEKFQKHEQEVLQRITALEAINPPNAICSRNGKSRIRSSCVKRKNTYLRHRANARTLSAENTA